MLEAALESFPQCVIQLYYLIQVGFDGDDQTIVVLFSILSIWNIATKMISEDKAYFRDQLHSLEFEWKPFYVNMLYILRVILRLLDFMHRLWLILLTWLVLGGWVVFIYLGFELFVLFVIGIKTRQLRFFFLVQGYCFVFCFLFCYIILLLILNTKNNYNKGYRV